MYAPEGRGVKTPGAGVNDDCKLLDMGGENWIPVFWNYEQQVLIITELSLAQYTGQYTSMCPTPHAQLKIPIL